MSTIKVNCTDQVLAFENTPVVTSGGIKENFMQFSFCSQWHGFARTAVFWRTEKEAYSQVLDASDSCEVPPEVTADEGVIYFGVFGVNPDNVQRTSNVLSYHIEKGAITTDLKPSDPTPDIYNQLLAMYAQVQNSTLTAKNIRLSAETAEALGLPSEGTTVDGALRELCGGDDADAGVVRYDTAQTLTEEQKAQALANLGLDEPAQDGGAVLYDTVQDLADTQKARARSNIGAMSMEDLSDAINEALGDYATAMAALDEVIGGDAE